MTEIDLDRQLDAPIDAVFDLLTDHCAYTRFDSISRAELGREGETEKNGLGAIRKLRSGLVWFDEEITAFERPTRMDYLIVDTNLPIKHKGGSITMRPSDGGTAVNWYSDFTPTTPVIGPVVAFVLRLVLLRSFNRMLSDVERFANEPAPAAAAA